ncbi:hypothetical protein ACF3DV_01070 [Chlorogloeopsis fritschii PCC 9212]|uniref:ATPase involved in DNA repair n=1 Tax=Chlorogloeopsis fritschii PCC 6912 TaxID=211165 RepID=A0A433NDT3_CHLFR|nr:hypothetical protein [Chlorogloeopsis fritschii]RUR80205.1 hypothetical protein PCC6912_30650 [Chlorogloeopsis fritschii PCC 6912]
MPRLKRASRILEKAQLRASGLKAIDPNIDFGDTNNLQNLTQQIEQLRTKIDTYNTALSVIDASRTDIEQLEKSLSTLCEKLLLAVAVKYGKDSQEYVMAGGVRKSDRIRKSTITRLKTVAEEVSATA